MDHQLATAELEINRMKDVDLYLTVEGLIGAGKSALMDSIKRFKQPNGFDYHMAVVDEPVDKWRDKMYTVYDKPYIEEKYILLVLFISAICVAFIKPFFNHSSDLYVSLSVIILSLWIIFCLIVGPKKSLRNIMIQLNMVLFFKLLLLLLD